MSTENPHAGQGSVLLDIGGDVGALIVEMPLGTVGLEVEIRPRGTDNSHGHHRHVAVVNRPTPQRSLPSLVFPDLVEGDYELLSKGGHTVHLTAAVNGSQVTQTTWPT